ncbi:MAG: sugar phosphate isomerase/epimerase [Chloroflexota bacterium]
MTDTPIALQLYTVRDALDADFEGTIRKLAEMGYTAVEAADFPAGVTPQSAKTLFDSLGLTVSSAHSKPPLGDNRNAALEKLDALGCDYMVIPWLDPDPYFVDLDGIKRACDLLNESNEVAQGAGLTLAYHNHWFEPVMIDGKTGFQHMLDYMDERIVFELDVYWTKVGGLDPVETVKELNPRMPLLHLKDGPAEAIEQDMTAVGSGTVDIPAIVSASEAKWHIVELDRCATDMLDAVAQSLTYLKGLQS